MRRFAPPLLGASVNARSLARLALLLALALGCGTPPPAAEEVRPAEELWAQAEKTREGWRILGIRWVDHTKAIETYQAIIDNYPYSDYAVRAELAIADAYFDDGKWEEALSYYRDFADLHPGSDQVGYAIYRAALCHGQQVFAPNRDQAHTRDALVFLDRLLRDHADSEYADDAELLWRSLRTQLAQQILGIADFYRGRDEWEAAAERYRTLLNEYPGLGLDAEALYKLALCYWEMNRRDEAERILLAIVQNYRDSDYANDAKDRLAAGGAGG
jgi:outer membrane protein assembly factor BamD